MAQAAHRVRIQPPDPGEAGVLASMIAPFVDLEVGLLESTLRRGPALVGGHLERREAEQLARLFVRLGARAEVVDARLAAEGDIDLGEPGEAGSEDEAEDSGERPADPIPPVRQTQPFDARVLREALNERVERASDRPVRPPPGADDRVRDATQPFNGLAIKQALGEALLPPPSLEAPPTRPIEVDGLHREPETLPRAPMRGRPARRSGLDASEPPPRALGVPPSDLAVSGIEPPPLGDDAVGLGSVDTASLAFEPPPGAPTVPAPDVTHEPLSGPGRALAEARPFESPRTDRSAAGWAPSLGLLPPTPPAGSPAGSLAASEELADASRVSLQSEKGIGEQREVRIEERPPRGPSAAPSAAPRPASTAPRPASTAPRPASAAPRPASAAPRPPSTAPVARTVRASDGPVAVRAPAERRPEESLRTRPRVDEPPPRPTGGHPTLDRARATAIRERVIEARPPPPPHHPWQAALLGLLPGMGQLYNGQRSRAVAFAVASLALLPWLYGMYDAWRVAQDIQARRQPPPNPAGRRAALPGQIFLDFAVFVALAGAWSLLRPAAGPIEAAPPSAALSSAAPPSAALSSANPPSEAPPTAPPTEAGPRPIHELLAEGRTHCGEGRFAECEARMLEIIEQRPDHIEAHRLLVDARTQRKAREGAPASP